MEKDKTFEELYILYTKLLSVEHDLVMKYGDDSNSPGKKLVIANETIYKVLTDLKNR